MNILSIIVLIFVYFVFKYLFRILSFIVIIKLANKIKENVAKKKDKRRK